MLKKFRISHNFTLIIRLLLHCLCLRLKLCLQ